MEAWTKAGKWLTQLVGLCFWNLVDMREDDDDDDDADDSCNSNVLAMICNALQ